MCYNRYSGSNHWGWGRYGGGVKTWWGVLSSCCREDSLLLVSSTLSAWSVGVISQSLVRCLSSSKWAWNDACLAVFPLMDSYGPKYFGQAVVTMFITNNHDSFHLWWQVRKLPELPVLRTCFAWKKIHNIVGTRISFFLSHKNIF